MVKICSALLIFFLPTLILSGCAAIQADMERYRKQTIILSEQAKLPKQERSKAIAWTMATMSWEKSAFSKAQKRFENVYKGMQEAMFTKQTKMQIMFDKDRTPIAIYGDGWLFPLDLYIKTPILNRNEYVFGFVENGVAQEQFYVVCENGEVIDIIELTYIHPKDIQGKEPQVVSMPHFWSKDAFFSAQERMKELKVGMDSWQMQRIMKGKWMELEPGRLYFICEGFLHNLYKSKDTPEGLVQELVFGYEENGQDSLQFVILLLNGKISEIRQL